MQADKALLAPKRGVFGGFGERGIGGSKCGATGAVAVLFQDASGKAKLLAANAGDARVVLARKGKAMQLTEDHVPDMWATLLVQIDTSISHAAAAFAAAAAVSRALTHKTSMSFCHLRYCFAACKYVWMLHVRDYMWIAYMHCKCLCMHFSNLVICT